MLSKIVRKRIHNILTRSIATSNSSNTPECIKTIQITSPDQERPPLNQQCLRLYGHHLCAYSEKIRLALAAKQIQYQRIEVDQSKKTAWHVAFNEGKVPFIELTDGTFIPESKVIMDYLEDAYPNQGVHILPTDPKDRALLRLAIPLAEAVSPAYYTTLRNKGNDKNNIKGLRMKMGPVEKFLQQKAEDKVFAWGTDHITQLDIHFYPYISRIVKWKGSLMNHAYEAMNFEMDFPRALRYANEIANQPELQDALTKEKAYHNYIELQFQVKEGTAVPFTLPVKFD